VTNNIERWVKVRRSMLLSQACLNQHHWLPSQMRQEGIDSRNALTLSSATGAPAAFSRAGLAYTVLYRSRAPPSEQATIYCMLLSFMLSDVICFWVNVKFNNRAFVIIGAVILIAGWSRA
jgi:hypothetical protein